MKPYYNPVLHVVKLREKIKELQESPISQKDKKMLLQTYQQRIIDAKSHIPLLPDKYAFAENLDGYNELARFINKQLTFGAIDISVNVEIVSV